MEQVTLSEKGLFVAERIETGRQLLSVIGGSHASMFDNDEVENEREAEIIGNFLQGAQDYLDLWDDMGNYERTQAQFEYNKVIAELEQAGFLVYGTQRLEKYKLSTSVIDDWRVAYMLVKRKTNPLVAKKSAEFESRVGIQSPVESEFSGFILLAREQSK